MSQRSSALLSKLANVGAKSLGAKHFGAKHFGAKSFGAKHFGAKSFGAAIGVMLLSWGTMAPSLAADPFRTVKPQPIGPKTEAAFVAAFRDGNYVEADRQLQLALKSEAQEPLVYALLAALAYREKQIPAFEGYTAQVRTAAAKLRTTQPLRSSLYTGIAHFYDGATILEKEGMLRGVSGALGKLQEVYRELDKAKAIDPKDPELNLVRGFMDVMLSTYLPLSKPEDAIASLQQNARPTYIVDYGLALAYRNLQRHDDALAKVNGLLQSNPSVSNPELRYLQAQLWVGQGKRNGDNQALFQKAQGSFDLALRQAGQLPKPLVVEIFGEACRNFNRIGTNTAKQDCKARREAIRASASRWGDVSLVALGTTPAPATKPPSGSAAGPTAGPTKPTTPGPGAPASPGAKPMLGPAGSTSTVPLPGRPTPAPAAATPKPPLVKPAAQHTVKPAGQPAGQPAATGPKSIGTLAR